MPEHPKVVWGVNAAQSKDWFNAYKARKLLRRPKTEEQEKERRSLPGVLTDPQGHIIRTRVRRFSGDMARVAQHFCQRRLREADYLGFVAKEVEKLLRSVAAMSSLRFTPQQVREKARSVILDVTRAIQEYPDRQVPLGAVRDLAALVVSRVEAVLDERDEEKNSQSSKKALPEYAPFLEKKIRALGLDVRNLPGLIETARAMGVDVDGILAKLEAGEEPEELERLLGG